MLMESKKADWLPLRDPVTKHVLASINRRTLTLVIIARGGPKVYELAHLVGQEDPPCDFQENMAQ